jgi:hypothetical protein
VASIDGDGGGASRSRATVLDRWAQHTAVCPDSRVAWRNITVLAWVRPAKPQTLIHKPCRAFTHSVPSKPTKAR